MTSREHGILMGICRNWRMLLIAIVAVLLASQNQSSSDLVRTTSFWLAALGVISNLLVICANGGRMPAHAASIPPPHESEYQVMDSNTRLRLLGDWIAVRGWLLSPGDVLLYTGLAIALASRLLGHARGD